jgi:hypothetical protein
MKFHIIMLSYGFMYDDIILLGINYVANLHKENAST